MLAQYPPVHEKPAENFTFDRLDLLWDRYPQHHEIKTFTTLEALLEEHASYRERLDEALKEEYVNKGYERFLIQLSWSDLPCRHAAKMCIEQAPPCTPNRYVQEFLTQFKDIDTTRKACFLFPESFVSRFFVLAEVCKKAEVFHPIHSLFPDEETVHYLAVFDKRHMDDVLLMFHLLYTNATEDLFGGYSLYGYALPWYQNHLQEGGTVLRSPYLPDRLARFQGSLPYYHDPAKTVYVRRNIEHILECGYMASELEIFQNLTRVLMPFFQWWYMDLALYETQDNYRTNWRLERTRIRTRLTATGVLRPKWKHELSLFQTVHQKYPDTLYQYRPDWLDRQSLDLFIPSLKTAIEYQGIQHFLPIEFFGGEEALQHRQELDQRKSDLCAANDVRLILWPYQKEPTEENLKEMLD